MMLTHPTLDHLRALKLDGMGDDAFTELENTGHGGGANWHMPMVVTPGCSAR